MNIKHVMESGKTLRYHTVESTRHQTVADHSWGVAIICLEIWPTASVPSALIEKALFHDCAEMFTGDVPAHAKWGNPELKELLDRIEQKVEVDMGIDIDLSPEERKILKLADMLELLFHTVSQLKLGNANYRIVLDRGAQWMTEHRDWWNDKVEAIFNDILKESNHV